MQITAHNFEFGLEQAEQALLKAKTLLIDLHGNCRKRLLAKVCSALSHHGDTCYCK